MAIQLVVIDVMLAALVVVAVGALPPTAPIPWLTVALGAATTAVYAITGTVATRRRPSNHCGGIMLAGAALGPFTTLPPGENTALAIVGAVLATTPLAVLVHLLLAFPSGRLRSRAARRTVAAAYAVCLVLQVPLYLFNPAGTPGGVLAIADLPTAVALATWLQRIAGVAVMIAAAVILAGRFRRAGARSRRILGPLYVYGIVAVLAMPIVGAVIGPALDIPGAVVGFIQLILLMPVPAAVAWAMLHGGFARTGNAQELGAWLSSADTSPGALRDALATSLGDPSVTLAFHGDEPGTLLNAQGTPVEAAAGAVDVAIGDRSIAEIGYDEILIADPAVVVEAGRAVAVALDRARLAAELAANHRELVASRARLVAATDAERRRIAQNLHDGLQADLVLLGIEAQELATAAAEHGELAESATALRKRIDRAAAGLRQVASGIMPPALVSHGLVSAVEDLLDRVPTGTHFAAPRPDALSGVPPHTQSTAYFVIAESLTNAMKHARATNISVKLALDGGRLHLEVADNGVGGAGMTSRATPAPGLGLGSIGDRVAAIGGTIDISSPVGGGTTVTAELPCAS